MRRLVPVMGVCALLVGCGGPAPPPFKPVVDTKLLMQAVVDPNADAIWDSVKSIDTKDGSQEIRPKTDEEWTAPIGVIARVRDVFARDPDRLPVDSCGAVIAPARSRRGRRRAGR